LKLARDLDRFFLFSERTVFKAWHGVLQERQKGLSGGDLLLIKMCPELLRMGMGCFRGRDWLQMKR